MEKQKEYDLRQYISIIVINEVEVQLLKYCEKYKEHIGFLLYYPLIKLEKRFCESDPYFKNAILDRKIISWFIRKMMYFGIKSNLSFAFDEDEYREFEIKYKEIKKLFFDIEFAISVKDMKSIGRIQVTEIDSGRYLLLTPVIINNNNSDTIYYYGLHDPERSRKEQECVQSLNQYIIEKYEIVRRKFTGFCVNYPVYNKFIKINRIIDKELLNLCINRVNLDIDKMGNKVRSEVIDEQEELKKFIGLLFYLSRIRQTIYFAADITNTCNLYDPIISLNKSWLINKMNRELYVSEDATNKYIDYFKIDCDYEGQLTEFPLIEYDDKIIIIPSSIMLNDWHFSIVNGHYFKKKTFYNREDTISISIVNDIIGKIKLYKNIVFCSNAYYEFTDSDEKFKNSDIDIGIYDPKLNSLLIIECKWKDNVFLPSENYITIEDAVRKIYSNQLDKHKEYLELSKENINYVFNNNSAVVSQEAMPIIYYICVEKRIEYHMGDKHMISIYHLLQLFESHEKGDMLDLGGLLESLLSLRTSVSYRASEEELEEHTIGDIGVLTDKTIYLNYCL